MSNPWQNTWYKVNIASQEQYERGVVETGAGGKEEVEECRALLSNYDSDDDNSEGLATKIVPTPSTSNSGNSFGNTVADARSRKALFENVWCASKQFKKKDEHHLSQLTVNFLNLPMCVSVETPIIEYEQRVIISSAYYKTAEATPGTASDALVISTSIDSRSTSLEDGFLTGVLNPAPCVRNVFAVMPVNTPPDENLRYGVPIHLRLIGSAIPFYLTAIPTMYMNYLKVGVTTALTDSCLFSILHRTQPSTNMLYKYPVVARTMFLIQHVESGLFLTIDCDGTVSTAFGLEYPVSLQELEYNVHVILDKHFFKIY